MPETVGLPLRAAEKKLRHAGCRLGLVQRRTSTLLRENRVLDQRPAPGRRRPGGTKILLVVGKGPKTGKLPSLGASVPGRLPPFIAYDPPTGGIWLVRPDGSDAHQVGPSDATDPVWSPDGTRILYTAAAPQNGQGISTYLYVMNADGSDQHPIMPSAGMVSGEEPWSDYDFHWSPEGDQIVFTHQGELVSYAELVNADGSDEHPANGGSGAASFSPDGSYLVFDSYAQHVATPVSTWGIYVGEADGAGQRQLTFGGGVDYPSWSPDGTRIVYGCLLDHAICALSGHPARQHILYLDWSQSFLHPTWNADGTKILVTVEQGENGPEQIGLMSPSGGSPVKVGIPLASGTYPDW